MIIVFRPLILVAGLGTSLSIPIHWQNDVEVCTADAFRTVERLGQSDDHTIILADRSAGLIVFKAHDGDIGKDLYYQFVFRPVLGVPTKSFVSVSIRTIDESDVPDGAFASLDVLAAELENSAMHDQCR